VNDEGDHLTAAELTSNVQLLLVAGHETMVNQIGLSMVTLFEHPDQMEVLRARPDLWPQAVEELLRHSQLTSAIMPRIAAQDFMLGGTPIGADEAVIPVIGTANRDPAGSRTRTGSTSCVPRRRRTSGSVTARTIAWAPSSPSWSFASRSARCSAASPPWHPPSTSRT